jgi:hypothetical protein
MERTALVPTTTIIRAHGVGMVKRAALISISLRAHRIRMMRHTALMSTSIRFLRHSRVGTLEWTSMLCVKFLRVWLVSLWRIPTTGFYRVRLPIILLRATRSLGSTFVGARAPLVARLRLQAPMVGTRVRLEGLSRVRILKRTALMLTSIRCF